MAKHRPVFEGPYVLAIHTATPIGSVAVFAQDQLMGHIEIRQEKSHAKRLTPMIQDLLKQTGIQKQALSAIAVIKGPGSYTGLRVGVSTAKGLCMALGLPLLSVDSLVALASQVQALAQQLQARICPLIDARRMEVYTAMYDSQLAPFSPIQAKILDDAFFQEHLAQQRVIFLGNGTQKSLPIFEAHANALLLPNALSSASSIGGLLWQKYQSNQVEDLLTFEPYYLKDFVATKPKNRLFPSSK
ncbi:MAG: tRNA (adenosine(37)-N6)-threonylcarbamoyltransferase complex dimerization subunit type 1 TsaB [Bacteroidota bacterium]